MAAKLKTVKGTPGAKTVKWSHGKYPPRVKGAAALVDAAAPSPPYVMRWDLYTNEPKGGKP